MVRSRNNVKEKLPLLSDLVEIQFRKGSQAMYVKQSFNQEYQQVNFLQPSVIKSKRNMIFPDHKTSRRGITSAKKTEYWSV